jgi:hypothetical protein
MLHNSAVEADVALSRCAPSGPRSLTPVVRRTPKLIVLRLLSPPFPASDWSASNQGRCQGWAILTSRHLGGRDMDSRLECVEWGSAIKVLARVRFRLGRARNAQTATSGW